MASGGHSEVMEDRRGASTAPAPARRPDCPPQARSRGRRVKHALDKVAAAGGMLVTAPVLVGIAVALRLSGPGRVLVRRARIGEGGRTVLLRSFAITDELRRSRAWRLVAATGVSALPELWSVLRGELSMVGPRPREPGLEPPPARPGLTGLAQLAELERRLSVSEQLALDAEYARTWSLRLDARIVWRTISSCGGRTPPRR
jgi:lipopolysaccharide/colanic/teichoic acid biosynthesis glycosyltransferase